MAQAQWYNSNRGIWNLAGFDDYTRVSLTPTRTILQYDAALGGPFDAYDSAWRIELDHSGRTVHVPGSGPDAGVPIASGGTLTGLRFLGPAGGVLVAVTGLSAPLAMVELWLRDNPRALGDYLFGQVTSYIGAGNAAALPGGATGDHIRTGAGADAVFAGGGDDFIADFGGADRYFGGPGIDELGYDEFYWRPQAVLRGVVANLHAGTVTGPDGAIDTVGAIENLRGSFLADILIGDGADNRLIGLAGADTIRGGAGFDRVAYFRDAGQGGTDGILADLGQGTVRDGFGSLDRIFNIEAVDGTDADDLMIDNGGDNHFRGRAGDDIIRVSGGDDFLGGGAGADRFAFVGTAFGQDRIDDFSRAEGDSIRIWAAASFAQLAITDVAGGALVSLGPASVLIEGWTAATLLPADFGF